MLNDKQVKKVLSKLQRFTDYLEKFIFIKADKIEEVYKFHTEKSFHSVPEDSFIKAEKGSIWQGEGTYCWYKCTYTVPDELAGVPIYIMPDIGCYEGLLYINGVPAGNFATKISSDTHGNHYCDLISLKPSAGEKFDIAIEYYAGHYIPGASPIGNDKNGEYKYTYNGIDICVKNYEVQEFYFDLLTLLQLTEVLPESSFRRAQVINTLIDIYNNVYTSTEDTPLEVNLEALRKVKPLIKKSLSYKNSDSAPSAAIIGHSHMDTAWLWHIGETVKKCARTYSNQLSLMKEYPEFIFIQSSACHSDMMRKYYPGLFEKIREAVAAGKYEPNGGVWVECDCNITGGESIIRQFLYGQRFTRKYFNYTSNCFWLPDTFGYSAAIPQIMKGCSVDYFLTTKISWNDTNKFPYDTFYWEGIDGTEVFTHFNTIHHFPDVKDSYERADEAVMQKGVTSERLLAYGFGDGGGGPQFEMIELARRCENLEGCPKLKHMKAGDFMKKLEADCVNPNTYKGELYLELHRGTLTNQHTIKRNNRKAEFALRNLEFFTVNNAVKNNIEADSSSIVPLYKILLINQFHDILPGTCINRAHEESRQQMSMLLDEAEKLTSLKLSPESDDSLTLINTLSFDRDDVLFLHVPDDKILEGNIIQQRYKNIDGENILLVSGISVPAFESVNFRLINGSSDEGSAFIYKDNRLITPYYIIEFAPDKTFSSVFDKRAGRQIVKGENFNTLLMAEDIPDYWDNWDIDADIESKFKNCSNLISSEIVSDGKAAFIIRNKYKISDKSILSQDVIFFADSAEIRFDTRIDWNDNHRFLKVAFDTDVCEDFARHEIQFGYVKRPTTRNNTLEQAKFEVVNHKYSDISEPRYGVAVLNDCKYGISAKGGSLRLSLHKGGNHPDVKGDKDGIHKCVYSVLPHASSFGADSVIKPSYMLNVPAVEVRGKTEIHSFVNIKADNCIIETIKPCEDNQKAFIARMYEAEGSYTNTVLHLPDFAKGVFITNMLEEEQEELPVSPEIKMTFRPFEIKTVKIYY